MGKRKMSYWKQPYPPGPNSLVALNWSTGVIHGYHYPVRNDPDRRSRTRCGHAIRGSLVQPVSPKHLNPDTTRPCKGCWDKEE
jgi:hypothetical protein